MVDMKHLRQWFDIADKDFDVAGKMAANFWPRPVEQVSFLCQQAAEKYLKGFLEFHDIAFPKRHDLVELIGLCCQINADYSKLTSMGVYLTPLATQTRYPNEMQLDEQDMTCALAYAKNIIAFVQSTLPEIFTPQKTEDAPKV